MKMHRSRTTEEARDALSRFCKAAGTHGDKMLPVFSIPVDEERDADRILSDVITERDALKEQLDAANAASVQIQSDWAKEKALRVECEKMLGIYVEPMGSVPPNAGEKEARGG